MRWLPLFLLVACATSSPRRGAGVRDPSSYEFHRALAVTLLRTEQPSQAIPHIRVLQQLRPARAEAFLLMGDAYSRLGVAGSARQMFEKAVTLEPRVAGGHAALGVLFDGMGRSADAERAHRRALALEPDRAAFHNNLGFSLYVQGRDREAAQAYERALALDAGMRRTHNNLGFAYGRLGELGRAREHFRLAGTVAEAENNLGLVHEGRGEDLLAYAQYRVAVTADPSLPEPRANLARVCGKLGRPVPELPAQAPRGAEP